MIWLPSGNQSVSECQSRGQIYTSAAWMRQACHEAAADRISNVGEHNRDRTRLLLQWCQCERAAGENDIRLQSNKFDCGVPYAVAIGADPAIFNADVLPVSPAELLKPVLKCVLPSFALVIPLLKGDQYADERHFSRLLRTRHNRPHPRGAD